MDRVQYQVYQTGRNSTSLTVLFCPLLLGNNMGNCTVNLECKTLLFFSTVCIGVAWHQRASAEVWKMIAMVQSRGCDLGMVHSADKGLDK